jgi:hypothetical protein
LIKPLGANPHRNFGGSAFERTARSVAKANITPAAKKQGTQPQEFRRNEQKKNVPSNTSDEKVTAAKSG